MAKPLYIQPVSGNALLKVENRVGLWRFGKGNGYGIYLYHDEDWYPMKRDVGSLLYTRRSTLEKAEKTFREVCRLFRWSRVKNIENGYRCNSCGTIIIGSKTPGLICPCKRSSRQ